MGLQLGPKWDRLFWIWIFLWFLWFEGCFENLLELDIFRDRQVTSVALNLSEWISIFAGERNHVFLLVYNKSKSSLFNKNQFILSNSPKKMCRTKNVTVGCKKNRNNSPLYGIAESSHHSNARIWLSPLKGMIHGPDTKSHVDVFKGTNFSHVNTSNIASKVIFTCKTLHGLQCKIYLFKWWTQKIFLWRAMCKIYMIF